MKREGDAKQTSNVVGGGFTGDATCSICGRDPHHHKHQAKELAEWRPGEPCVVGIKGGERVLFDCPYCGASRGPLDLGWLPEHLPLRVVATCCGSQAYHIVAEEQPSSHRRH